MNKKLAFDNRLCYERDVVRQQSIHHHKLETVLPTSRSPSRVFLDRSAPAKHPHLATNAKRLQQERERQLLIYQQNQRLANRMEHIMHRQENALLAASHTLKPPPATARASLSEAEKRMEPLPLPPSSPTPPPTTASPRAAHARRSRKQPLHSPAHVHVPGMRLDAHQTPLIDCHLSPEFAMGRGNACKKQSLVNKTVQRRQQARIEEENRRLKQRLAHLKPYYNAKQWDGEWQQQSKKFGHLRQDGTVGYLLPPPPKTASATDGLPTTRSPWRRPPSPQLDSELPSIHSPNRAKQSSDGQRKHQKQKPTGTTPRLNSREGAIRPPKTTEKRGNDVDEEVEEEEEEQMQLIELLPFTLLEATTRKGVEITVGERQIELSKLGDASKTEIGDRGFVVSGSWSDGSSTFEGQFLVGLPFLEQVAQEIDDLETMIKLETVIQVPDVGNFPRLSTLLSEEELQQLLVAVIHHLRFQLVTDTKELWITCRLSAAASSSIPTRPPRARAERDPFAGAWRDHARPKTCPSTLPSEPLRSSEGDSGSSDATAALESMHLDEDALTVVKPEHQLAALMREATGRRFGTRVGGQFTLANIRFDEESAELITELLDVLSAESETKVRRIRLDAGQLEETARQLGAGASLRETIADQLAGDVGNASDVHSSP